MNFAPLVNWLDTNWLTLLTAVVGLVVTYIVYCWQHKEKKPLYAMRSFVLVANAKESFPLLTVHYKGHGDDLNDLCVSLIAVWNAGRETIDGKDITAAKPLQIVAAEGVKILGASKVQDNNTACQPQCNYSKINNNATLTFDYLDHNNGFVVEVIHTGVKPESVSVVGTMKGCGEISKFDEGRRAPRYLRRMTSRSGERMFHYFLLTSFVFSLVFGLVLIVVPTYLIGAKPVTTVNGVDYIPLSESYYVKQNPDGSRSAHVSMPSWATIPMGVMILICLINIRDELWRLAPTIPHTLTRFNARF